MCVCGETTSGWYAVVAFSQIPVKIHVRKVNEHRGRGNGVSFPRIEGREGPSSPPICFLSHQYVRMYRKSRSAQ